MQRIQCSVLSSCSTAVVPVALLLSWFVSVALSVVWSVGGCVVVGVVDSGRCWIGWMLMIASWLVGWLVGWLLKC